MGFLVTVPALVIKRWRAHETATEEGGFHILIEGRGGGLVSWLLHLVQIEPLTRFAVTSERVELEEASLSGKTKHCIPLEHVSYVFYGYYKPWKQALAVLLVGWWLMSFLLPLLASLITRDPRTGLSGLLLGTVLSFVFALIAAVIYYILSKSFVIGFDTESGKVFALRFKRSLIENQEINSDEAAYVAELLDYLCDTSRNRKKPTLS